MAKSEMLKKITKITGNKLSFSADDENNPYEISGYIDTGCYALNAICCDGNIYGGIPKGRRIAFSGPSGVAKSLLIMYICAAFLKQEENGYIVAFESEGATMTEMARNYGIDPARLIVLPVTTIEEFKCQATKFLEGVLEERQKMKKAELAEAPQFLMVLDSLGMLGTEKEFDDAMTDNNKADMTRAKQIRSVFRLITLKLSLTQTTLLISNHVYACMSEEARVKMANGAIKNINEIEVGEFVRTLEGDKKVTNKVEYDTESHVEIVLEDGTVMKCTPNHEFLVKDEHGESVWKESIDIISGDLLVDDDGCEHSVSFKKVVEEQMKVYDISVKDAHHYILENGIASHNTMDMYSAPEVSGGGGVKYASDVSLLLSKAKEKEGSKHVGALITLNTHKSRYQPEGDKVKIALIFKTGLFKYSYLLDYGIEAGLIKKEGISYIMPDGQKAKRKTIIKKAEEFFSGENLDVIAKSMKIDYSFGSSDEEISDADFDEMVEEKDEESDEESVDE